METLASIRQRLEALRVEHRDLDSAIHALAGNPAIDQMQLTRLKRRKLMLKDAIARLESELIPDLDA
ncbi:MAG: YdcH family protein [Acidihalobacter sp.]